MDLDALVTKSIVEYKSVLPPVKLSRKRKLTILELWERKINLCLVSYLRIMERFATKSMNVNNWQSIIG